jgi:hypothetical protein
LKTARVCAKAAIAAAKARASGKTPVYKGVHSPDILNDRGHQMGYKDVSNYVAGPKHTKHAVLTRGAKMYAGQHDSHFWTGYKKGRQRAIDDWHTHIKIASGYKNTRTMKRLVRLENPRD